MPPTRTSRLPIRVRLVAGFSAAMFVVLLAAGAFVYWRVQYALDRGLDTELATASATIAPTIDAGPILADPARAEATGTAWQVLDEQGRVVASGGPAPQRPLVTPSDLARAAGSTVVEDLGSMLPAASTPYRLHLTSLPDAGGYLVVAVRRDHRDEALRELLLQLTVVGLAALVVTAVVGDRLARAALAPVERYRRRAAEIAQGATRKRIDVPPGRDDEITRLGHTLNQMLAAIDASLEAQERFVHEASHELRTPLTLLKGRLQLAARRARTVAEHEEIVGELSTDVSRLVDLADQLTTLGSSGASPAAQGAELVDVTQIVMAVAERHGVGDAAIDVTLLLTPSPAGVLVAMAPIAVDRILTNLLTNALIHGECPVTVEIERAGGWVRIAVRDSGPGMPPDLLASATTRFTRAPQARARPGSGLGLTLVEMLTTQAGGELRLCFEDQHASFGTRSPLRCETHRGMVASLLLVEATPTPDQAHPGVA